MVVESEAPTAGVHQQVVTLQEFYSAVGTANVQFRDNITEKKDGIDFATLGPRAVHSLCGPLVVYDFDETLTRATYVETGWDLPEKQRYRGLVEWGGFDAERLNRLHSHLTRVAEMGGTPVILSFNGSWADPTVNFDLKAVLAYFGLLECFAGVCGIVDIEKRGFQNVSKAAVIKEMMRDPESFFGRPHEGTIEHAMLVDDDSRHCDLAIEAGLHAHLVQKYTLWPGHDPVGGIERADYFAVEAWVSCRTRKD
jgi:hypothetical protein